MSDVSDVSEEEIAKEDKRDWGPVVLRAVGLTQLEALKRTIEEKARSNALLTTLAANQKIIMAQLATLTSTVDSMRHERRPHIEDEDGEEVQPRVPPSGPECHRGPSSGTECHGVPFRALEECHVECRAGERRLASRGPHSALLNTLISRMPRRKEVAGCSYQEEESR